MIKLVFFAWIKNTYCNSGVAVALVFLALNLNICKGGGWEIRKRKAPGKVWLDNGPAVLFSLFFKIVYFLLSLFPSPMGNGRHLFPMWEFFKKKRKPISCFLTWPLGIVEYFQVWKFPYFGCFFYKRVFAMANMFTKKNSAAGSIQKRI